ncbi:MAG: GIY-YIG nuclease family protein [Bacteroidales bacterium]|nr:GIY-YIG nuclease family protein [Bacteroidales bacterium]
MFAIVDIETTGGSPISDKITEIAVYKYDGEEIVESFVSLINPEIKIPYYITQLTGISNSMVTDSPKFYEVAKKIVEITSDCIFVAHNATFDYNFIREEFKRLGYTFQRDKLCTVTLSRKIFPGYRSYSLGKICNNLGIEIQNRHRADGDAYATVLLFKKLQNSPIFKQIIGKYTGSKNFNNIIDPIVVQNLPEEPGVYYFYNDKSELIYIGKSKSIKTRVVSHFRNYRSKKAIEMRESIAEISFELTGCELIAELLESAEIKSYRPVYNRAQRRTSSKYGIYQYKNMDGYICLTLSSTDSREEQPIQVFSTLKSGRSHLIRIIEQYELCQKLCGLYQSRNHCFHYEIMQCKGACIGKESPADYNSRVMKYMEKSCIKNNSYFIVEQGRNNDELSVIKIENGVYKGFGYLAKEYTEGTLEDLDACIKKYDDNKDVQQILRRYLNEGHPIDIINYKSFDSNTPTSSLSTINRL